MTRPASRLTAALLLGAALLAAPPAPAQEQTVPATLVADRVRVEGDRALVAEGNVEVIVEGARLTASAVRFDRETDIVTISGPIQIDDGEDIVIVADAATLDEGLMDGILTSARLVLERQLQIAAAEIARAGPTTRLSRVVASSCRVCEESQVPTWEIRAREVTLDETRERLTFEGAQLRAFGLPVAALPRLTLPAPGVQRAQGFLVPEFRSTTTLGPGIITPYFIPLGEHRDITLLPYVSTESLSLGARYRQAFRRGEIEFEGAGSVDDTDAENPRGFLFGSGDFVFPGATRLSFDVRVTSDDEYLLDFGISDDDRLRNEVVLSRALDDDLVEARFVVFQDLREVVGLAESSPRILPGFEWSQRMTPDRFGIIDLRVSGDVYLRDSDDPFDTDIDIDTIADGRDAVRVGAGAGWRMGRVLPGGLAVSGLAQLDVDGFVIADDAAFDDEVGRVLPSVGADLRWPLRRVASTGTVDIIEPAALLAWTLEGPEFPPPEDAARIELDEGNLFSLSRFAGEDAFERGARAGYGVSWRRHTPAGWTAGGTLGQVVREEDDPRIATGTGLGGTVSDLLVQAEFDTGAGLALSSRSLIGDDGTNRSETLVRLGRERLTFDAAYVFIGSVTGPDGIERDFLSQVVLDADAQLTRRWSSSAGVRFDFEEERAESAILAFAWRNECAEFNVSLESRFDDDTAVDPDTRLNVSVALLGFGNRAAALERATCSPTLRSQFPVVPPRDTFQ